LAKHFGEHDIIIKIILINDFISNYKSLRKRKKREKREKEKRWI